MKFRPLDIPSLVVVEPKRHGDPRGFFAETFRLDLFRQNVGDWSFVQGNQSRSARKGTIRGLHFQRPPRAQGKLVRVGRGAVLDVAVDIRHGSPHFGRYATVELSAENGLQLWVPPGFLHGFCTLCDDTEVLYSVTDFYSPEHDGAVRFDDPAIGIPWPVQSSRAIVSDKDGGAPPLSGLGTVFTY